ncbi:Uncharacterized protein TPAR_04849 [Tolypocladium paradoxum]|uniref:Apple domain-containing protein n=1 Tax=Tolypocladium paradoxum TaxID=94208 RepID=A0A2S4KXQ7_9HYPO|nr:Uncharacterized protein TPAR_04849 [Tolypocladium paradoxum]
MKVALSSVVAILVAAEWTGLVAAQSKYACPGDDGKTIIAGGKKYKLMCGSGIQGMPIEDEKPSSSLEECAERCAANAGCLHSTLLKNGKCALKKAGTVFKLPDLSTWFFVEDAPAQATPVDSSQKPITSGGGGGGGGDPSSYTCPADEKKRYTTNGITYELRCNTGHSLTHWKYEPCPSLKECADRCAKDPECYSCDFTRSTHICAFKKSPSETTAWSEGDAWYPVSCPDVRETQAKEDPEITSSLGCPDNNGKIWEGSDGTWFYLQCCTDTNAATVVEQGTASSHKECIEKCVANKKCKRLYGNGGFSTVNADRVHHAFVTLPPTKKAELTKSKLCSTECPHAHGQLFVGVSGENFLMSCNKRHGTTYLKVDRRDSYEACMTACAVMPECRSVDYEPRTKRCFYGSSADQPSISADAFLSAHSLGCAGACSACKKGCDKVNGEPLPADAARCDADHGQLLIAGGEPMRLSCKHCWHSAVDTIRVNSAAKSLAECARICGQDPYCHGANWMGPSGCAMHPNVDKDGKAPFMKRSAQCDSITPLTRSLAEYKEEDIQDSGITDRSW